MTNERILLRKKLIIDLKIILFEIIKNLFIDSKLKLISGQSYAMIQ